MKTLSQLFCVLCVSHFCVVQGWAGSADTNLPPRLTVEMRDGSRVVGQSVEDTVSVHSAAIGNLKLAWATIRAIEYAASADTARLTATNGDGFAVQLDTDTLRLQTDFGKTELPVKMIRSIKVTPETKRTSATATTAVSATGFQLSIELRDGSHLVGKGLDDALKFHSATMGDLKLTWAGIRSVIFASEKSSTARLTTTNGDAYEVEFVTAAVRVETSFGKNELPVKSIRSIKVSALGGRRQLPAGLVALWSGEGDGTDSVGGNTATLTDIAFEAGKVGQAFSFNGTGSSIKIPAHQSLNVGAGDGFTLIAWIKPTDINRLQPILEWNDGGGNSSQLGVHLYISQDSGPGSLYAEIADINTRWHQLNSSGAPVKNDLFQLVALTYDKNSGVAKIYYNGTVVAEQNMGRFTPQTTFNLYLGRRPSNEGLYYTGLMDEVGIYNRALAAEEIRKEYEAENIN